MRQTTDQEVVLKSSSYLGHSRVNLFLLSVVEISDGGLIKSFVDILLSSSSNVDSFKCILVDNELFPLSSIVAVVI